MTDPAIQDVIRQRIAIHGATAETRDKTMTLIDAWGAEREAAGAVAMVAKVREVLAEWRLRPIESAMPSVAAIEVEAVSRLQSCQDTLREIMGVDGRSE